MRLLRHHSIERDHSIEHRSDGQRPPQHRNLIRAVRIAVACVLGGAVIAVSAPASAGGWAVASLDTVPAATAGDSVDVGFTVLQHGQTPAVLDADVGIELVLDNGAIEFFPAIADGAPGHYVATVAFPESGSYEWNVRMGWFGTYELGALDVVAAPETATSTSLGGSSWPDLRWVTLAASASLAAVAIVDVLVTRARRRTVTM